MICEAVTPPSSIRMRTAGFESPSTSHTSASTRQDSPSIITNSMALLAPLLCPHAAAAALAHAPIHWPARNAPAVLCTSTIHIFLTPASTGTIRPLFAGSRAVKRIAALGRELLATHDAGFLRSASWLIGSRVVNSLATSIAANEEAQTLRLVIDEDRPIATTARQCRIPWSSESPLRALQRTLLTTCAS